LDEYNKNRKKKDYGAEKSREEKDEIKQGDHLQKDQHENARELLVAEDREFMPQSSVIGEPENEINEDRERCGNQGGHGTGIGCVSDGAKEPLCYH
jgi:hypothetical protein